MHDDHDPQAEPQPIPPSFIALFVPEGRIKPTEPRAVIQARHEFCEDLAQALSETAQQQRLSLGVDAPEVLRRIGLGVADPATGLTEVEQGWVMTRLAELIAWQSPAPSSLRMPR
jgi:hypothetical protein